MNKILKRDMGNAGWTVNYKTLQRIQSILSEEYCIGMEEIEEVILALERGGFVTIEEQCEEEK